MAESKEELKSLLMKMKQESWLETQHSRNEALISSISPNRWGKMETVTDFIFLDSKITAEGDCSHEIKRHLLLGRKVVTNLDRKLKSWDITLPTKVHVLKAMVFLVVMYGCELDQKEHQRIDAFELWCSRRLLRVPWTRRRSN